MKIHLEQIRTLTKFYGEKKKSVFVVSEFVKTCDELVTGLAKKAPLVWLNWKSSARKSIVKWAIVFYVKNSQSTTHPILEKLVLTIFAIFCKNYCLATNLCIWKHSEGELFLIKRNFSGSIEYDFYLTVLNVLISKSLLKTFSKIMLYFDIRFDSLQNILNISI